MSDMLQLVVKITYTHAACRQGGQHSRLKKLHNQMSDMLQLVVNMGELSMCDVTGNIIA